MKRTAIVKKYGLLTIILLAMFLSIAKNLVDYTNYMIQSQQKDFLRLARSMTYGVGQFLDSEKTALDEYFFLDTNTTSWDSQSDWDEEYFQMISEVYLENMPDTRNQVLYVNETGEILMEVRNPQQTVFFEEAKYPHPEELGEKLVFGKALLAAENAYLVPIIKQISHEPERCIVVMINMSEIYQYLDTAIQEEKDNGYVALKNPEGYILYHKNPSQIGLHMVRGRREKYPELNFDYMEQIEKLQAAGEEATYVYDSYWMIEDPPVKKRKKIVSFTPLQLDYEFWLLTLNLDYYAYIDPLQRYMYLGLGFSFLVFLVVGWMLFQLIRGQENQRKMYLENRHLQEMNAAMDELNWERIQRIHAWKLGQVGIMTEKIVHDFNNFLLPIIGYTEFLLEADNLTEQQREDAQKILGYAEKASDMTRRLNQFGRQEQIEVSFGYIDFSEQISEWLDAIKLVCPAEITMDWGQIPQNVQVYGNATQLQEVIWNLCRNAMDAIKKKNDSTEGIIQVGCHVVKRSQIVESRFLSVQERDYLEITVEDTGCGMNEVVIEQIFNPFFTTKKAEGGTGLGLGICHDIVVQHGGEIQVKSVIEEGSCFTVYIPCKLEQK